MTGLLLNVAAPALAAIASSRPCSARRLPKRPPAAAAARSAGARRRRAGSRAAQSRWGCCRCRARFSPGRQALPSTRCSSRRECRRRFLRLLHAGRGPAVPGGRRRFGQGTSSQPLHGAVQVAVEEHRPAGPSRPGALLMLANAEICRDNANRSSSRRSQGCSTCAAARWLSATRATSRRLPAGRASVPERVEHSGGPPLCVLEGFEYPSGHRVLEAGEWLCVLTDGVTEAMNAAGEFYGAARLHAVLKPLASAAPDAVVARCERTYASSPALRSNQTTLPCFACAGTAQALADVDLDAPVARLVDVVGGRHE